MQDATQAFTPSYVEAGDLPRIGDRLWQEAQRAGIRNALMGSMGVVEVFELAQSLEQMPLVPDQGSIEELAPAGLPPVGLIYSLLQVKWHIGTR
ncbi:hypothetical protein ACFVTY_03185 [Streptomyces sp. NPDC058067]|uniref:hypothetical protein n=1 Tax=Streptomyces sp. NPDC058067 TaxID=3346324 RepID=UPI0036E252A5